MSAIQRTGGNECVNPVVMLEREPRGVRGEDRVALALLLEDPLNRIRGQIGSSRNELGIDSAADSTQSGSLENIADLRRSALDRGIQDPHALSFQLTDDPPGATGGSLY